MAVVVESVFVFDIDCAVVVESVFVLYIDGCRSRVCICF